MIDRIVWLLTDDIMSPLVERLDVKTLVQAMKPITDRFHDDFMVQLTREE